ncbi:MAG: hypothetical protein FWH28_07625, partial [Clostridiales bacterium]|nr:hypothetical protein [Clostridiales bacterium]
TLAKEGNAVWRKKSKQPALAKKFFRQTRRRGRTEKECIQTYMTEPDDEGNAVWRKKSKQPALAKKFFRQTRRRGRTEKECIQTYMTEPDDEGNAVWRKKSKPKEESEWQRHP